MDNTLWVEKYRPDALENYLGNDHVKQKLAEYIEKQDIPHLLFNGPPGTGKTTAALMLKNLIECDSLVINASDERGIDIIREKIKSFASTRSFAPNKIVVLDECLDEDTEILVVNKHTIPRWRIIYKIPIKDVDPENHLVVSWDGPGTDGTVSLPFEKFDKGVQDVFEIEFENGAKVVCTGTHKWYVLHKHGDYEYIKIVTTDDLTSYEHVLNVE